MKNSNSAGYDSCAHMFSQPRPISDVFNTLLPKGLFHQDKLLSEIGYGTRNRLQ